VIVALQNGAKKIYAIDVGTNQLDKLLKENKKIILYENTDFRNVDTNNFLDVDMITIDVSFISVVKLLDNLSKLKSVKEVMCLIKPQFECGKEFADKYKGIVLNRKIHKEVIENIINSFEKINYFLGNLTFSPISGGSGNIEYLAYFTKTNNNIKKDIDNIINEAFEKLNKKN